VFADALSDIKSYCSKWPGASRKLLIQAGVTVN